MTDSADFQLIERLAGLGKIQAGHKYNVKTRTSSASNSWWTSFGRYSAGEGRTTLREEFQQIRDHIKSLVFGEYDLDRNLTLLTAFEGVENGLNNLLLAYPQESENISENSENDELKSSNPQQIFDSLDGAIVNEDGSPAKFLARSSNSSEKIQGDDPFPENINGMPLSNNQVREIIFIFSTFIKEQAGNLKNNYCHLRQSGERRIRRSPSGSHDPMSGIRISGNGIGVIYGTSPNSPNNSQGSSPSYQYRPITPVLSLSTEKSNSKNGLEDVDNSTLTLLEAMAESFDQELKRELDQDLGQSIDLETAQQEITQGIIEPPVGIFPPYCAEEIRVPAQSIESIPPVEIPVQSIDSEEIQVPIQSIDSNGPIGSEEIQVPARSIESDGSKEIKAEQNFSITIENGQICVIDEGKLSQPLNKSDSERKVRVKSIKRSQKKRSIPLTQHHSEKAFSKTAFSEDLDENGNPFFDQFGNFFDSIDRELREILEKL